MELKEYEERMLTMKWLEFVSALALSSHEARLAFSKKQERSLTDVMINLEMYDQWVRRG